MRQQTLSVPAQLATAWMVEKLVQRIVSSNQPQRLSPGRTARPEPLRRSA